MVLSLDILDDRIFLTGVEDFILPTMRACRSYSRQSTTYSCPADLKDLGSVFKRWWFVDSRVGMASIILDSKSEGCILELDFGERRLYALCEALAHCKR